MIKKGMKIAAVSLGLLLNQVFADDFGATWTEIYGLDEWPALNTLAEGYMWCPGGTLEWLNPLTPDCGKGKRFNIRDVEAYSCLTGMTMDYVYEPRISGTMWFSINANLDTTFSGPVHGEFIIVPGASCDPDDLDDPTVYWEGTWNGKRTRVCDPTCSWIGNLSIVGHGYGGELEGLEMRAEEVITTYTALPAPWEYIPGFPYTGPEGQVHGFIKEHIE
jgi:hypothetical protein